MKRFYKIVTLAKTPGGQEIHLDGKPVKSPSGKTLRVPNENLAAAIMREWAAQDRDILPDTMPLTQILITAQDRVALERAAMEKAMLGYLDTDLLCYRAVLPAETARRQAQAWDPWLAWFEGRYGVRLLTTESLQAIAQSSEAHEAVRTALRGLDDLKFSAVQLVVSLCGSVVLGLALAAGAAAPEQVFAAAQIEEDLKAAFYNEDKHGTAPHEEKRRTAMRRDLQAARDFLQMLG